MEITPYFSEIQKMLIDELSRASKQIDVAVAWFTNHEIFDVLLSKLPDVKVRIVVINDDVNNRFGGLDFQKFIDSKGEFYFAEQRNPMHNKYCIIDDSVLITGSFNYTYWADSINDENVVKFVGCNDIIELYKANFNDIIRRSYKVADVSEHLKSHPFISNIYSYNNFIIKDIYRQSLVWKEAGKKREAEEILKNIQSDHCDETAFAIENIVYRQWKESYMIKHIGVNNDEIVIRFQTPITDGCFVWGPDMLGTWIIQDSEDKSLSVKSYKISNVSINNETIISEVPSHTVYRFYEKKDRDDEWDCMFIMKRKDGRYIEKNGHWINIAKYIYTKEGLLSCDIHFHAPGFSQKTIDLIEGKGSESMDNHWHCFDIDMRLNRIYGNN